VDLADSLTASIPGLGTRKALEPGTIPPFKPAFRLNAAFEPSWSPASLKRGHLFLVPICG